MPPAKRAAKKAIPAVLASENPGKEALLAAKVEDQTNRLAPGVAVLLPDGGEAVLIGTEGHEALLRCGTLHHAPIRCPVDKVRLVAAADETPRHEKFRREALRCGEIKPSEDGAINE